MSEGSKLMFEIIHFRHKWRNRAEVESKVIHNGEVIAVSIVHVDNGAIRLTSGGFDSLEEHPKLQALEHKTHAEHWTDAVKHHATSWARQYSNNSRQLT